MIRFSCECGRQLQAREENAGKVVLCPVCKQRVTVPDPDPAPLPEEHLEEPPAREQHVQRERPALRMEDEEPSSQLEGSSGKAVVSLILGLLSVFCNVLTGLPAVLVGIFALGDIGRSNGRLSGRGLALTGIISACVGTLLSCVILVVSIIPLTFAALVTPAVQKVQEAAGRAESTNNLRSLGLAMHNHQAVHGHFPPAAICDKRGKPLLSWRVALLPYLPMEPQQALHAQFKLNEPWDGPHNIKLLKQMPRVYKLAAAAKTPPDHTHYQVFVGNGAAFEWNKPMHIPADFPDGTSNTILIAEADNAVPWTKPDDVPFDPGKPMLPLMSHHFQSGFHVALCDGSIRLVTPQVSEKTFKAAITRGGNDLLGPDW